MLALGAAAVFQGPAGLRAARAGPAPRPAPGRIMCSASSSRGEPVPAAKEPTALSAAIESRRGLLVGTAMSAATLSALAVAGVSPALAEELRADAAAAGKRVVVTGSNTGIGKAIARQMADLGWDVVLACRSPAKAAAAAEEIIARTGNQRVSTMELDLADLASVRGFAGKFKDEGKGLDVLMNNAGVMATPEMRTKDGFEYQVGINHLGHFLLTALLEDPITANGGGRVVFTSSEGHQIPNSLSVEDLNFETRKYEKWTAYGQSKLCNVLTAREMARRCSSLALPVTATAFHPGVVDTELIRYVVPEEFFQKRAADSEKAQKFVSFLGLKTPDQGAETGVYLATSPDAVSGKYYDNCKVKPGSKASQDMATAGKVWELSRELTGAPDAFKA